MSDDDTRITEIQEKHLFLEHQVETLDTLVRELHDELAQVRRELASVRNLAQTALTRSSEEDDASPDS